MSSNYPTSVDSFDHKDEGPGNYIFAADINAITAGIVATQNVLGVNPAGSADTVALLLVDIQDIQTGLSDTVDTLSATVESLLVTGGPTGPTGPAGQPRFVGTGSPTPENSPGAIPGDRYLDESTGQLYTFS